MTDFRLIRWALNVPLAGRAERVDASRRILLWAVTQGIPDKTGGLSCRIPLLSDWANALGARNGRMLQRARLALIEQGILVLPSGRQRPGRTVHVDPSIIRRVLA